MVCVLNTFLFNNKYVSLAKHRGFFHHSYGPVLRNRYIHWIDLLPSLLLMKSCNLPLIICLSILCFEQLVNYGSYMGKGWHLNQKSKVIYCHILSLSPAGVRWNSISLHKQTNKTIVNILVTINLCYENIVWW